VKLPDLKQTQRPPSRAQMDALDNWIVIVRDGRRDWPEFPYAETLHARYARLKGRGDDAPQLTTDLANPRASHVALACVKPDAAAYDLLTRARKLVAAHRELKPQALGIVIAGFTTRQAERVAEALVAAALAAGAEMPDYRSKREERAALASIQLYGAAPQHRFQRSFAEAEGNALARYLTALPPNDLTPALYRRRVADLARQHGWRSEFYGVGQLEQRKAGAFLAVTQASPERDAGIMRLRYRPPGRPSGRKLALVGKGICFDTGGVNVKSAKYMHGMHEDMEGSAVALGTLLALTRLQVKFPIECWLALATNHIGPRAYKPNDVVTALNGTTIEVVHSDAEGRMVLADTLVMASRARPDLIIDYATLTGACVYAIGKGYSGVFSNRQAWLPRLVETGAASGERVWPFPLDADYDEALESHIADVKQCSEDGGADHILAARFLSRFIEGELPWIHVDLSSGNRKGGLAHIPTDVTGFGVRFTLNLLLDQKLPS
jgi:leucyl aminopeptidase